MSRVDDRNLNVTAEEFSRRSTSRERVTLAQSDNVIALLAS